MSEFKGKSIVITGACRGIGRGIAEYFAKQGARLMIVSNAELIYQTQEEIKTKFPEAQIEAMQLDVTNEQEVQALFKKSYETFKNIDIGLFVAGIITIDTFEKMSLDDFRRVLDVNTTGVWLCNREISKYMKDQKYGRIINMSSLQGRNGFIYTPHYAASKMGVIGVTQSLALELAPFNVTVNAICPGIIMSDMWEYNDRVWGEMLSTPQKQYKKGELMAEWVDNIPMKKAGTAEDIANAAAFFASEKSHYITGQSLNVCGGMAMN